jgi:hypothetical protein
MESVVDGCEGCFSVESEVVDALKYLCTSLSAVSVKLCQFNSLLVLVLVNLLYAKICNLLSMLSKKKCVLLLNLYNKH